MCIVLAAPNHASSHDAEPHRHNAGNDRKCHEPVHVRFLSNPEGYAILSFIKAPAKSHKTLKDASNIAEECFDSYVLISRGQPPF
jgi:hypothetical protein